MYIIYTKIIESLNNDDNFRIDAATTLNFLEKVALLVEDDLVEEEIIKKFFRGIVIDMHNLFRIWIEQLRRSRNNDKIYEYLTKLYKNWNNNNNN